MPRINTGEDASVEYGGGCGAGLWPSERLIILEVVGEHAYLALIPIRLLKPHEQTIPERLRDLTESIIVDGVVRVPVIVDSNSNTILDGHHRVAALRTLGARWVPALAVDYMSEVVELKFWRPEFIATKQEVLEAAAKGILLPPKTTRHILKIRLPPVNMPLHNLTGTSLVFKRG